LFHTKVVQRAMERIGENTYVCTVCQATVTVESDEPAVVVIVGQSGQPNIRVASVEGVEIHRCVLPDAPRTIPP
jgi:hypothetical protein